MHKQNLCGTLEWFIASIFEFGDSIFGDFGFTMFVWIQNPFIDKEDNEFGLANIEKEKLIGLFCDTTLKHKF